MTSTIYNEVNPVGFDYQVLQIQQYIAALNLIQAIFPVAHVQCELRTNEVTEDTYLMPDMGKKGTMKHERWFPQSRQKGQNIDLTITDAYSSRIFFLAKDQIDPNPSQDRWDWTEQSLELKQSFAVILSFDIAKVNNLGLNFTGEQVKLLVLGALYKVPQLICKGISENIDNVWKEFSMTQEINGFAQYPKFAIRFECEVYYYPYGVNGGNLSLLPKYVQSWVIKKIQVIIVAGTPNSSNTQNLNNSDNPLNCDIILKEYNLNGDNTVTVGYLNSVQGISVLTNFGINNTFYQGNFFINGKINTSQVGVLGVGDTLVFDANIPFWS